MNVFASVAVFLALSKPVVDEPRVKFEVYKTGNYSSIQTFKLVRIKSEDRFKKYWSSAHPGQPLPDGVDWTTDELLAVHLGQRNTGGYGVYVDEIVQGRNRSYMVKLVEQQPKKGLMVTMAITSPYMIVKLARHSNGYSVSKVVDVQTGENPDPRPRNPPAKSPP